MNDTVITIICLLLSTHYEQLRMLTPEFLQWPSLVRSLMICITCTIIYNPLSRIKIIPHSLSVLFVLPSLRGVSHSDFENECCFKL